MCGCYCLLQFVFVTILCLVLKLQRKIILEIVAMGRNRIKRKNGDSKKNTGTERHVAYESVKKGNVEFEGYYKIQKICPDEEWSNFMNALNSDLPTAFRITGSKTESKVLLAIVQGKYFMEVLNARTSIGALDIEPVCLPWYPDKLAWQIQLSRRDIRRSEAFFKLHNFLISETASGNISRQEVVSMIPPIALDIKPHHKVLDMCAAPGSKTAQLIEYLHKGEDRIPKGFVIANDVDNNRCYMLVHQAKRLSSPNVIITNHDATILPNFVVAGKDGSDEFLKFDRILCDVPCSGDGTLRKNPDIWPKWNAANGANLHGIQYRVIKRGCEMLAIGGRAVYSTCSLNPIENEAVITRLLLDAQGSLQLLNADSLLPGLKFSPGMRKWSPTSRDLVSYETPEDVPEKWKSSVRKHMFPPTHEEAEKLNLEKCIRVLPHYQDTGGFFIAVIEKVKLLPWESASKESQIDEEVKRESPTRIKEPARKKRKFYGFKEDPFIFFEPDEPIWKQIKSFYGFNEDFPANCLLTRCKEGKRKNLYMTSPQVRDIVMKNASKFKIINTGVKTFARCDNKEMNCDYRLVQEALWSIIPWMGKERLVHVTKDDLIALLSCEDLTRPPLTTSLSEQIQNQIAKIGQGSCVLVFDDPESDLRLKLVGWVGSVSTRAYIPQSDCIHYLRLLGGDTTKFEVNKFQKVSANDGEGEAVELSKEIEENMEVEKEIS